MSYAAKQVLEVPSSQLMSDARKALSGKWGLAVATVLVFMVISAAAGMIPGVSIIIGGPLALGFAMFSLNIARNKDAELSNLFDGFSHFVTALVANILMGIAIVIGFILLIIPGFIIALGLSQTYFILADNPQMGAVDAMKQSWEMMKGNKGNLFVLWLIFFLLMIASVITLFIGLLWLIPYMQVTLANFYDALRYTQNPEAREDNLEDHLVDMGGDE